MLKTVFDPPRNSHPLEDTVLQPTEYAQTVAQQAIEVLLEAALVQVHIPAEARILH
ncbi:hypothetical protein ACIP02_12600 [Pseudomonas sp. NPDC089408]|uniref:hypothetical protein n=1 Tax=Pseudomonas sp. NPDC089408 TaxID=3364465 RepID=UPI0038017E0F